MASDAPDPPVENWTSESLRRDAEEALRTVRKMGDDVRDACDIVDGVDSLGFFGDVSEIASLYLDAGIDAVRTARDAVVLDALVETGRILLHVGEAIRIYGPSYEPTNAGGRLTGMYVRHVLGKAADGLAEALGV
jgi:hypothetical protein